MKLYNWSKFNESETSREKVISMVGDVCKKYNIKNWTVGDGVNVKGSVDLSYKLLKKLPLVFGEVDGNFKCSDNRLKSIEESPQIIRGNFNCSNNIITTLVGGPKEVWGYYRCYNNHLTDVRGFPEYYRGEVLIGGNPVEEIISLFKGVDKDIIIETLNDYNVIRPGNKVNLQLLKYAFDELNISMPEIELIEGYEII